MDRMEQDPERLARALDCFDQLVAALLVAEVALERSTPLQQPFAESRTFHFKVRMEVRAALVAAGFK